jgi:hydroxymethylbilane synthase
MTSSKLRIVTRESPLAMWQANFVRDALCRLHPALEIEVLGITTEADRLLDSSLESLGGKGAFVKELEQALLNGQADIAVHSMKDVSIELPDNLILPVVLKREDARDVFVSNQFDKFADLPTTARIGTSSLRRTCQLKSKQADFQILDIRGNVGTRLRKLDEGEYDALVLAAAGVKRLGLEDRIKEYFSTESILPAVSQGALGIEIHEKNTEVLNLIEPLTDDDTYLCVKAERALNRRLGGDCHVPIAAYAQIDGAQLSMHSLVGKLDGSQLVKASLSGPANEAEILGDELGRTLLEKGAGNILQELKK